MTSNPDKSGRNRTIIILLVVLLFLGLSFYAIYKFAAHLVTTYGSKGEFYNLAVADYKSKNYPEALKVADMAISKRENDGESELLRAQILEDMGRHDESQAQLKQIGKEHPALAIPLHHEAYELIREGDNFAEVVRLENLAISINPAVPKFYINRAYGLTELNQSDKAVQDCSKGLSLKPTAADEITTLFQNRANAYIHLHKYKEALADATEALANVGSDADTHIGILENKILALIGLKRFNEVESIADEAIKLDSEDHDSALNFTNYKIEALKGLSSSPETGTKLAALAKERNRLELLVKAEDKKSEAEESAVSDNESGNGEASTNEKKTSPH